MPDGWRTGDRRQHGDTPADRALALLAAMLVLTLAMADKCDDPGPGKGWLTSQGTSAAL